MKRWYPGLIVLVLVLAVWIIAAYYFGACKDPIIVRLSLTYDSFLAFSALCLQG
jgi:hypothetical protein